jgi:hypothetical protein
VPLAPGKTQHAVKNKDGGVPRKEEWHRKITKGRDLKRSIENTCHDRYYLASSGLSSLLLDLHPEISGRPRKQWIRDVRADIFR